MKAECEDVVMDEEWLLVKGWITDKMNVYDTASCRETLSGVSVCRKQFEALTQTVVNVSFCLLLGKK